MKKISKRLLSAILAIVMLASMVPNSVFKATATTATAQSDYVTGDIIEYGSYPQTKVTNALLISALNAATLQDDDTVTFNHDKYKKVYFTANTSGYETGNGYLVKTVYWFKYEPVRWRVLSNRNSELFIMSEKILDTRAYNNVLTNVTWETSTVRSWLNVDFYNKAFDSNERARIKTSVVTNDNNPWNGVLGGNNTNDKIFLLSYAETMNTAYGFNSNQSTNDSARQTQGTDYSISRGLYVHKESLYNENSYWWLRSPGYSQLNAGIVSFGGRFNLYPNDYGDVELTYIGVRPALILEPTYSAGDIIEYGSYPQTKVSDENLITTLNAQALQVDSTVTYGGAKYQRVYFTQYNPYYPGYPDNEFSYQDDNGYYINTVYWFKFEPIQWRVLSNNNGELFVMAEKILESRSCNQPVAYVTWETCTLRTWLNNDFYNTAFNAAEQAKIKTSAVINDDNPWNGTDGGNNTADKVFLLSFSEVVNPAYGFSSNTNTDYARQAQGSDFAKSCGLYVETNRFPLGNSYWGLRTPDFYQSRACPVLSDGVVPNYYINFFSAVSVGVRPALKLNLKADVLASTDTTIVISEDKYTILSPIGSIFSISAEFSSESLAFNSSTVSCSFSDPSAVSLEGGMSFVGTASSGIVSIQVKVLELSSFTVTFSTTDGASSTRDVEIRTPKKAIYFLPGYMGSKLYDPDGKVFWFDRVTFSEDLLQYNIFNISSLSLNESGEGNYLSIDRDKDNRINDGKYTYGTEFKGDSAKTIMERLKSEFLIENGGNYDTVKFFSYDWRKSLKVSMDELQADIDANEYDKVVLVCHSTGGLLAAEYIATGNNVSKVEKVVTLGSPLLGTYEALTPLETGKCQVLIENLTYSGSLFLKAFEWAKAATKNTPCTYQLLPCDEYVNFFPISVHNRNNVLNNTVTTISDFYNLLNSSTSNLNTNMIDGNGESHKKYRETYLKAGNNPADNIMDVFAKVDAYHIAGINPKDEDGYLKTTDYRAVYKYTGETGSSPVVFNGYEQTTLGDGTAVFNSALGIYNDKDGTPVLPKNYGIADGVDHPGLKDSETVLNAVVKYINDGVATRDINSGTTAAKDATTVDDLLAAGTGMSDKLVLRLNGALDITVLNSSGVKVASLTQEGASGFSENGLSFSYVSSTLDKVDLYFPNTGFSIIVTPDKSATGAIEFSSVLRTLQADGSTESSANYSSTLQTKETLTLNAVSGVRKDNISNIRLILKKADQSTASIAPSITKTNYATGLTINEKITVNKGSSLTISAVVSPTNTGIIWSSSDKSIITVDSNGKVTAVGFGKARVTAATSDGSKFATCYVTVPCAATGISFTPNIIVMSTEENCFIKPVFTPAYATNTDLTFVSNNVSIATVNEKGLVSALKAGTTTITAATGNGKTATIEIVVSDNIAVKSVSISQGSGINLSVGAQQQMAASIEPGNADNQDLSWSSSNNNIVSIDSSGLVKAVSVGVATITVTTNDGGYTASSNVTVTKTSANNVILNATNVNVCIGESTQLLAIVSPVDATNKNVIWSSSNTNVVTVSSIGLATAVSVGNATITVKTVDGNKTATCSVNVTDPTISVTGITISQAMANLSVNATIQLTAGVLPSNATNKNVTWSSSNTNVVTVTSTGLATAVSEGTVTITVTTVDGGFVAKCEATVATPLIKITKNNTDCSDKLEIKVPWYRSYKNSKNDIQLGFSTNMGTDVTAVWSSDNPSKVQVDQTGKIKNLKTGARTANITVNLVDRENNVIATDSLKVIFYKYNWQLKKLQTQSFVSDNYAQRNMSAQEFEELGEAEPAISINSTEQMQKIVDMITYIVSLLRKIAIK